MVTYTGQTIGLPSTARRRMEELWELPRTLRGGTPAMRAARTKYLPMNESEEKVPVLYDKRLLRARLFPGYKRAITDLASLPFQKSPTLTAMDMLPPETQRLLEDADRSGSSLWAFMQQIHDDAIDRGLGLFMVDTVPLPPEGVGRDEAERIDARPYFVRIAPDNVVGCLTETRYGREEIVDLRIREYTVKVRDNGTEVQVERIRHWTTTDVEVWEADDSTVKSALANEQVALVNATTSGFTRIEAKPHGFPHGIPAIVHYTNRVGPVEAQPPLTDLAWENVAHWQAQSGHTEALRFGRFPTLVGTNVSSDTVEEKPRITAGGYILDTTDSNWRFVEPGGQSFTASREDLAEIKANMAWMAMQPLVQANGPATATGEVRADVREKALAQQWAEGLEWAFYRAFGMAVAWLGQELPPDFNLTLFRDFAILSPTSGQDLAMLQQAVRDRVLTRATFLKELKRRDKMADDFDPAAEEETLTAQDAHAEQARMESMAQQFKEQEESARQGGEGQSDDAEESDGVTVTDDVTINEITLGIERLERAGDQAMVNALRKLLADTIGAPTPPPLKVKKLAPVPAGAASR